MNISIMSKAPCFLIATMVFASIAEGQRPSRRGNNRQFQNLGANAGEFDANNAENFANAQHEMNGPQSMGHNMPSIDELSQMMMSNFDADRSGTLDQSELQNALVGLRELMMQNQRGNQNREQSTQTRQAFLNARQNQVNTAKQRRRSTAATQRGTRATNASTLQGNRRGR